MKYVLGFPEKRQKTRTLMNSVSNWKKSNKLSEREYIFELEIFSRI